MQFKYYHICTAFTAMQYICLQSATSHPDKCKAMIEDNASQQSTKLLLSDQLSQ